jgi:DNA repair protein RAD50
MSRLDSLKIKGIRSYGPDKPEIIAFDQPVTVILGKNGSGKTVS